MEVHFLSNESVTPAQLPEVPIRSPVEIIKDLRCVYDQKQVELFRDTLDSLASNVKFDIKDLDTIMMDAIKNNDTQFAVELLSHGLPLLPDYVLEATKWKAKNVLELFFCKGWDINKPLSDAQPPVLSFVTQDHDMMSWLLDRGADPNKRCAIDLTPLSYAVKYASVPNINLLLRSGGDTQQGQLLFHALDRESEIIEVLQLLLKEGALLNAKMYQNHYPSWSLYYFMGLGTVLHKAAELGNVQVVKFLVSEGIDLSITDANGRTALDCARNLRKVEVVKVLEDSLSH